MAWAGLWFDQTHIVQTRFVHTGFDKVVRCSFCRRQRIELHCRGRTHWWAKTCITRLVDSSTFSFWCILICSYWRIVLAHLKLVLLRLNVVLVRYELCWLHVDEESLAITFVISDVLVSTVVNGRVVALLIDKFDNLIGPLFFVLYLEIFRVRLFYGLSSLIRYIDYGLILLLESVVLSVGFTHWLLFFISWCSRQVSIIRHLSAIDFQVFLVDQFKKINRL